MQKPNYTPIPKKLENKYGKILGILLFCIISSFLTFFLLLIYRISIDGIVFIIRYGWFLILSLVSVFFYLYYSVKFEYITYYNDFFEAEESKKRNKHLYGIKLG